MISYFFFIIYLLIFFSKIIKSFSNASLFFIFIFPFNVFIPVGIQNLNTTELLGFFLFIFYIFKGKLSFKKAIPFDIMIFCIFLISLFIALVFNGYLSKSLNLLFRFFIYGGILIVFNNNFKNINFIKKAYINLRNSYFLMVFILSIEFIYLYFIAQDSISAAINWKYFLFTLGFYPQTIDEASLYSWSALGSLTGTFVVHHSLAIYLSFVFLFSYILKFNFYISSFQNKIIIISSIIFLFFTNSRSIIISLFLILFISYFKKSSINKKVYFVLTAIILFLFIITTNNRILSIYDTFGILIGSLNISAFSLIEYKEQLIFLLDNSNIDPSLASRLIYNINSLDFIINNFLFGSGFEGQSRLGAEKANPHSLYFFIFQSFGVITFLLFIKFIKTSYHKFKQLNNSDSNYHYIVLYFIIISLFINVFSDLRVILLYLIFLTSINSSYLQAPKKQDY
jgi:hypothetical protein